LQSKVLKPGYVHEVLSAQLLKSASRIAMSRGSGVGTAVAVGMGVGDGSGHVKE
tara:strand:- start:420 stop:581 length:162 start_codon:yes stop_codon:yes gene_type:complete